MSLPPWLSGDSQHTLFSLPFEISLSETACCLWIGSSAGLLMFNLASFELEAVLHYKGKIYLQRSLIQTACNLNIFLCLTFGGSRWVPVTDPQGPGSRVTCSTLAVLEPTNPSCSPSPLVLCLLLLLGPSHVRDLKWALCPHHSLAAAPGHHHSCWAE